MSRGLLPLICFLLLVLPNCKQKAPSAQLINDLNLKRGQIVTCGAPDQQFGSAEFETSCSEKNRKDFNLGIELLHSFEYDEAEKAFANLIDREPSCAMAYWGIAMANFHPLWTPPTLEELKKGAKAIDIAKSLKASPRESAYIAAIASFYRDWEKLDHITRTLNFERGMQKVYEDFPGDKESEIFYALSLVAAADPSDKSYVKQKKAGDLLNALYPSMPNHPGIVHYLIHTYDYPELAQQALAVARKYAAVAPSSAHALHMPSHVFTRLGLWDECIQSNLASVSSARCYAESTGIMGHWDEELHGLDYVVYGYLQKGENDSAKKQLDYLNTIKEVHPVNFKVAYAFAAIPARYALENKDWEAASSLPMIAANISWKNFPWQEAITHFARLLGAVHIKKPSLASAALKELNRLHDTLTNRKDAYQANQVAIQIKAGEAWIRMGEGKMDEAIQLMQVAAEMEDKTEKHPVTPCEVIPARELLGDLYMELNRPAEALVAYRADLETHPNRFNGIYGAAEAAQKSGDRSSARNYFQQLVAIAGDGKPVRRELKEIEHYLK
jgi:tetratricopeptide (TPR) repeat protein